MWQLQCPQYMNNTCKTSNQNNTVTKNFSLKLFQPLRHKTLTQLYLGPFIQNGLSDDFKLSNNVSMLEILPQLQNSNF